MRLDDTLLSGLRSRRLEVDVRDMALLLRKEGDRRSDIVMPASIHSVLDQFECASLDNEILCVGPL